MAEGVFQHLANQPPYKGKFDEIDSCGTGQLKGRNCRAKVMLYGEFSGTGAKEKITDPYYEKLKKKSEKNPEKKPTGFEIAFEQCSRFAGNFLDEVVEKV